MSRRIRPLAAAVAALAVLTVAAAGSADASVTQDPVPVDDAAPGAVPAPGEGLSPEVAAVPATSATLDAAAAELAELERRRDRDAVALAAAGAELTRTLVELDANEQLLRRREDQVDKAAEVLEERRGALGALTVERFVGGDGVLEGLDPALSAELREELGRRRVLTAVAGGRLVTEVAHARGGLETLTAERDAAQRSGSELAASATDLGRVATDLAAGIEAIGPRIVAAVERVESERVLATVDGSDMSVLALDAYWRAASTMSSLDPSCGVSWWVLAGIGRTESRHGTYGGSALGRDGVVDPPILGPELDGSNLAFAVVPDTDGGALDGTSRTDRAVGPMQFLPGTWRAVGSDATGDGEADPQNIYDAALSAAVYLCRSGPGLGAEDTLRGAILTYNRSQTYVDIVLERGRGYAGSVPLGGR